MNFFAELRRRNVIRMAGLYLVGPGWRWLKLLSKPRRGCGRMLAKRIWRARNIFIMVANMPARWQSWRLPAELYRMIRVCSN
jgi:hypothetical protein